jgi:dipeptidyl aminopeptidase/acylaminoacyl peptidase
VTDDARAADPSSASSPASRLDSWKEIAAYLRRDVTTVRRWEKREGLPVYRHLHERRESVYAYASEIDRWWQGRRHTLAVADKGSGAGAGFPEVRWPVHFRVWPVLAIAGTAITLVVLLVGSVRPRDAIGRVTPDFEVRFSLAPVEGTSFGTGALSPDGRHFAFTASSEDGTSQLWLRSLDAIASRAVPDTHGATFPFWSPGGDKIGFFARGSLWTVQIDGGRPQRICAAPDGRGGSWNDHGIIVFAPARDGPLARVAASGGDPVPVTALAAHERAHLWPAFLPGGRRFLYLADSTEPEHHQLFAGALDETDRVRLLNIASDAAYAEGLLLYTLDRQLVAQPFDAATSQLSGVPTVVVQDVVQPWNLDHKTDFSVSNSGVLMFRTMRGFDAQLAWRGRDNERYVPVTAPAGYSEPTLSPTGTRLAVDLFDSRPSREHGFGSAHITSDIWLMDADGGAPVRLTDDPGAEFNPVWSPDGTRIVYSSNVGGNLDLFVRRADRPSRPEVLLASRVPKHALAWSPDGRFVVYATLSDQTRFDLWMLALEGDRVPVVIANTRASETQAQVSPDGRWLSYTSNESGQSQVYVQRFPSGGGRVQVSANGGGDARWRADGRELYYIASDRRLMAVEVTASDDFAHGRATPLFDTTMSPHWGTSRNHYDVADHGNRFLSMVPVADDRLSPFTIVLNWGRELPRTTRR